MALSLPYDGGPHISNQKGVLFGESKIVGTLAFRNHNETTIFPEVSFQPYLVHETKPCLRIEVFETAVGKQLCHFTDIPLVNCRYLAVESGDLASVPNTFQRWSGDFAKRNLSNPLKYPKKGKTFVFSIHVRGLEDVVLRWYGNRREHMSALSKQVLDRFDGNPKDLELDILMVSHRGVTFENAEFFKIVCNHIHNLKCEHLVDYGTPHSSLGPPIDKDIADQLDPDNPQSPLYDIVAAASLQSTIEFVEEPAVKISDLHKNAPKPIRSTYRSALREFIEFCSYFVSRAERYDNHKEGGLQHKKICNELQWEVARFSTLRNDGEDAHLDMRKRKWYASGEGE